MTVDVDWTYWGGIAVLLVSTLILANALAGYAHRQRLKRIVDKSQELYGSHSPNSVPITLLTGFLGSGKTTLLNRILRQPEGRKVLVIENELGSISIDHELLETTQDSASDVIVLKNGCICCSADSQGDELERILDRLLEMRQQPSVPPQEARFDTVVIECTGLADPAPIIQLLHRREMAGSGFHLDAVVAMVDAKHIGRHLSPPSTSGFSMISGVRTKEAEAQIAFADVVLVNKVDTAALEQAVAAREIVHQLNPCAKVLETSFAEVSLSHILDLGAFDPRQMKMAMQGRHVEGEKGRHTEAVQAIVLEVDGDLDGDLFGRWIRATLDANGEVLYRVKGLLAMHGEKRRVVLHAVHEDMSGGYGTEWTTQEARRSVLVFIGRHMRQQRPRLREGLRACRSASGN